MTDWVRLWHDMPTDPKWRTIARKSGQRVGDVIAVFNFLLVNASGNASERGTLANFEIEDVASALDLDDGDVQSILDAMHGKVIDGGRLTGWERRQPKREDSSAFQRKEAWKERKKIEAERNGTQRNATERQETETETDTVTNVTGVPPNLAEMLFGECLSFIIASGQPEKSARSLIGKWRKQFGDAEAVRRIAYCQANAVSNPVEYVPKMSGNGNILDQRAAFLAKRYG
ncbi:MAG: hypothetical protein ACRCVX_12360 [Shewanella sp.]